MPVEHKLPHPLSPSSHSPLLLPLHPLNRLLHTHPLFGPTSKAFWTAWSNELDQVVQCTNIGLNYYFDNNGHHQNTIIATMALSCAEYGKQYRPTKSNEPSLLNVNQKSKPTDH